MFTIEFYTPEERVPHKLLTEIRNELVSLSHLYPLLARAEVVLRVDDTAHYEEDKICELKLIAFGSNLSAFARTGTFTRSARETLRDIRKLVKLEARQMKGVPDTQVSTVKV